MQLTPRVAPAGRLLGETVSRNAASHTVQPHHSRDAVCARVTSAKRQYKEFERTADDDFDLPAHMNAALSADGHARQVDLAAQRGDWGDYTQSNRMNGLAQRSPTSFRTNGYIKTRPGDPYVDFAEADPVWDEVLISTPAVPTTRISPRQRTVQRPPVGKEGPFLPGYDFPQPPPQPGFGGGYMNGFGPSGPRPPPASGGLGRGWLNGQQSEYFPDEEYVYDDGPTLPKVEEVRIVNGKTLLCNTDIKNVKVVRLQGSEREALGIVDFKSALAMAQDAKVDLVLVNETQTPPICRLIAWDRYKFELEKGDKEKKKKSIASVQEVKEMRLGPKTDVGDVAVKIKQGAKMLEKGNKLKITMKFEGRELQFKEQGKELLLKFLADLTEFGKPDGSVNFKSGSYSVLLSPVPPKPQQQQPAAPVAAAPRGPLPMPPAERPPAPEGLAPPPQSGGSYNSPLQQPNDRYTLPRQPQQPPGGGFNSPPSQPSGGSGAPPRQEGWAFASASQQAAGPYAPLQTPPAGGFGYLQEPLGRPTGQWAQQQPGRGPAYPVQQPGFPPRAPAFPPPPPALTPPVRPLPLQAKGFTSPPTPGQMPFTPPPQRFGPTSSVPPPPPPFMPSWPSLQAATQFTAGSPAGPSRPFYAPAANVTGGAFNNLGVPPMPRGAAPPPHVPAAPAMPLSWGSPPGVPAPSAAVVASAAPVMQATPAAVAPPPAIPALQAPVEPASSGPTNATASPASSLSGAMSPSLPSATSAAAPTAVLMPMAQGNASVPTAAATSPSAVALPPPPPLVMNRPGPVVPLAGKGKGATNGSKQQPPNASANTQSTLASLSVPVQSGVAGASGAAPVRAAPVSTGGPGPGAAAASPGTASRSQAPAMQPPSPPASSGPAMAAPQAPPAPTASGAATLAASPASAPAAAMPPPPQLVMNRAAAAATVPPPGATGKTPVPAVTSKGAKSSKQQPAQPPASASTSGQAGVDVITTGPAQAAASTPLVQQQQSKQSKQSSKKQQQQSKQQTQSSKQQQPQQNPPPKEPAGDVQTLSTATAGPGNATPAPLPPSAEPAGGPVVVQVAKPPAAPSADAIPSPPPPQQQQVQSMNQQQKQKQQQKQPAKQQQQPPKQKQSPNQQQPKQTAKQPEQQQEKGGAQGVQAVASGAVALGAATPPASPNPPSKGEAAAPTATGSASAAVPPSPQLGTPGPASTPPKAAAPSGVASLVLPTPPGKKKSGASRQHKSPAAKPVTPPTPGVAKGSAPGPGLGHTAAGPTPPLAGTTQVKAQPTASVPIAAKVLVAA